MSKILLAVEEAKTASATTDFEFLSHSRSEIGYHVSLLVRAGFLDGITVRSIDRGEYFAAVWLTWEGHEFLDRLNDQKDCGG